MNKMHHCLLRVTMETNTLGQSAHERDLAPLFGDFIQSEKLSAKIKWGKFCVYI